EDRALVHGAVQPESRARAELDGLPVENRQCARQAETDRADVDVRLGAELVEVAAEELRPRLQLHVDLQADDRLELSHAARSGDPRWKESRRLRRYAGPLPVPPRSGSAWLRTRERP